MNVKQLPSGDYVQNEAFCGRMLLIFIFDAQYSYTNNLSVVSKLVKVWCGVPIAVKIRRYFSRRKFHSFQCLYEAWLTYYMIFLLPQLRNEWTDTREMLLKKTIVLT